MPPYIEDALIMRELYRFTGLPVIQIDIAVLLTVAVLYGPAHGDEAAIRGKCESACCRELPPETLRERTRGEGMRGSVDRMYGKMRGSFRGLNGRFQWIHS